MISRVAIEADIHEILALHTLNLLPNLSEAERSAGFVTTVLTPAQIKSLITQAGVFVVEQQGVIVGYALAGSWDFFSQWPIFPYMVARFPQLKFQGASITTENSFQYGPVCIDRTLRGSNALPLLFETMRSSFANRYSIGVTFINKENRSC